MGTKIYVENNGMYGAVIHIGNEHIFTVGKDFDELGKNIDEAMICAFGKQAKKQYKFSKTNPGLIKLRKIAEGK
ncbi:MAG: hypothetical protein NTX91_02990 [candidate division SR1 bacterium]|nr:hypothetical protein [candidate division SR1 bacterium]